MLSFSEFVYARVEQLQFTQTRLCVPIDLISDGDQSRGVQHGMNSPQAAFVEDRNLLIGAGVGFNEAMSNFRCLCENRKCAVWASRLISSYAIIMEGTMTEAGRELFSEYLLGLLADSEKQESILDTHIREVVARSTAADMRLSEIEEEVRRLRVALTEHLLAERKSLRASNAEVVE